MSITGRPQDHRSLPASLAGGSDLAGGFPPGFLWGAATSAYQIEGAVREDGRAPSIWDRFVIRPGAIFQGQTGDVAADHYHHMEEDVALMARLNLRAYRFSIAWPRVLPQGTGPVNERGLAFYERLVDTLLARGIEPLVTLYHWDLPAALEDRGGWLVRDTAQAFAEYAEVVARRLGDRVRWWITQNEPWCSSYLGYALGIHAPGMHDKQLAVTVGHHILLSHGLATQRLRSVLPHGAQIGIALDFYPVYAADERPETLQAVEQADTFRNRWFLDPLFRAEYPTSLFSVLGVAPPPVHADDLAVIATPLDFLGVNYYSRMLVRGVIASSAASSPGSPGYEVIERIPGAAYTDMGWEIFPEGLEVILTRLHREYRPKALLVTENGAAFEDHWHGGDSVHDWQRIHYLQTHIEALSRALAQQVPLKGYMVWSLLDNFEWAFGYSKRFGLVYVDYSTQRRIVKDSGRWYASFIAAQRR
ncbi:GH1 family beta-glucosidase [Thermogemmatispora sp.]|uniref:GH1 family beta-glucosidase n=1 Tax=Thermogemmatispora sp. TaxID=1968838 RepID=UPI001D34F5A4|nr:GH1 family beta-glucosidase [Thermogemmatispora sp.]MBX5451790.1 beta-glucosidase [Thermogemmatispora sp.]